MDLLYLDCISGISGNMFIGALLELIGENEFLIQGLKKLKLDGYRLEFKKLDKMGISSGYFNVVLDGHSHKACGHNHSHHSHEHHDENNHEHPHHEHGHNHTHNHSHSHNHGSEDSHQHSHHRNFLDIKKIIENSDLSEFVKEKSLEVFKHIAIAEGKIHNKLPEEVHFHEVGAIDSIIDAVGAALCVERLGRIKIMSSNIPLGTGFVNCEHGLFPVPVPATMEILSSINAPVYRSDIKGELVTPTGAAILATFVEEFAPLGEITLMQSAYGAGSKNFKIPNVLRVYLGKKRDFSNELLIECNIDDMTGEEMGHLFNILSNVETLDTWYEPIFMKKNRPAYKLSILIEEKHKDEVTKCLFKHSSTLGIRVFNIERTVMKRNFEKFVSSLGEVTIKSAKYKDIQKCSYEYEDLNRISKEKNIPLREIILTLNKEYFENNK